jgi:hypothetical protein
MSFYNPDFQMSSLKLKKKILFCEGIACQLFRLFCIKLQQKLTNIDFRFRPAH